MESPTRLFPSFFVKPREKMEEIKGERRKTSKEVERESMEERKKKEQRRNKEGKKAKKVKEYREKEGENRDKVLFFLTYTIIQFILSLFLLCPNSVLTLVMRSARFTISTTFIRGLRKINSCTKCT